MTPQTTSVHPAPAAALHPDAGHAAALRLITCGSVDDGKSTLIGRLLYDSRAVLQDQLTGITHAANGNALEAAIDLARLTDGLSAEREQGITIDVAYRYFATQARKFIIGDAPGHEQYTRNMVTAASSADAAVVLVDATKLDWRADHPALLPQTRRHALLAGLLRVPSIVFAVNKLDAVKDPSAAWTHIRAALASLAQTARLPARAFVPISALKGWNVVDPCPGWAGYDGPALLDALEQLPATPPDANLPLALPVQWIESNASSSDTAQSRRVLWGRIATGRVAPGDAVQIFPSGQRAAIAQVIDRVRHPASGIAAGQSVGVTLDRELDISRGDWIVAAPPQPARAPQGEWGDAPAASSASSAATSWQLKQELAATIAWLDDEPLAVGRVYWALHGHRWIKARVTRIVSHLDIHTLAPEPAAQLTANAIGDVELKLQEPIPAAPYAQSRTLGALILVDAASNKTAGAVLVRA